jgi:hypothetical protein
MNLDGEIELSERNEVSQARVLARENLKETFIQFFRKGSDV